MTLFPIFVKLEGKKCVVVGAGNIAAAKARGLLRSGARVVVIGPDATKWVKAQARARKLTWQPREFARKDVEDAFLVVAATDSSATNEAVFRASVKRRVLCNVVDDPDHCDFYYPAIVRRGPLQIAISTGGRSPALARRLRIELARLFGPEYGGWVEHVGDVRKRILRQHPAGYTRQKLMDQIASRKSLERWKREHHTRPRRAGTPATPSRERKATKE
jgi:precorrin-2 dehydrogenase/sirohydrochlorin ferrochelatase